MSAASFGESYVRIPKVRPPDKKKYEEDMDALSNTIKTKETQLVSFSVVGPCFCFGVLKQSCQLLGGHKTITKAKIILASKSAFY